MANSINHAHQEMDNHFKSMERDMSHMFDFAPSFPKMISGGDGDNHLESFSSTTHSELGADGKMHTYKNQEGTTTNCKNGKCIQTICKNGKCEKMQIAPKEKDLD